MRLFGFYCQDPRNFNIVCEYQIFDFDMADLRNSTLADQAQTVFDEQFVFSVTSHGDELRHVSIRRATSDQPLVFSEVAQLWQGDNGFRLQFTNMLSEMPFEAFFWECPPVDSHCECRVLTSVCRSPP